MMKRRIKKTISPLMKLTLTAVSALAFIGAVIVRFIQLCKFTDSVSGNIQAGYEYSIICLYCFFIAFVFCVLLLSSFCQVKNPFAGTASSSLKLCSFLAGCAMFYDFVRQCLNFYYYFKNEYFEYVYLFFIAFNALAAFVSAFYFFLAGISFNTPNYDFAILGGLHTAPFLWAFSRMLFCLSLIVNPIYSQEDIFAFLLIVVLTLFFMQYLVLVDRGKRPAAVAALGLIYSFLAFSVSLPRLVLYFTDIELVSVYYSAVTYFISGIFVLAFSLNILVPGRKV